MIATQAEIVATFRRWNKAHKRAIRTGAAWTHAPRRTLALRQAESFERFLALEQRSRRRGKA